MLVLQAVFMGQGGQWLAQLDCRPQEQPFGFLAVVIESGVGIEITRQPCFDRIDIGRGSNLRTVARSTVGAVAAIQQ